nr:MAG TPA: hypothetical protein [Caudoviricetes sp.]
MSRWHRGVRDSLGRADLSRHMTRQRVATTRAMCG